MVSVAILAVSIVPILILREDSFNKAMITKAQRSAQQLAQQLLSQIALEERVGEGAGEFEDWPDFRYEYSVTLYDFGSSFGGGDFFNKDDPNQDPYYDKNPDDSVMLDEELKDIGPLMMRHVEMTITFPNFLGEETGDENEYIIDTYLPMLMTEEQFEHQQHKESDA
ncbi:MAG: hypothetical protein KJ645_10965 [Planctomycetes bacterium]|nr:hypothetical protein [Planctomycetota bacterium]